MKNIYTDKYLKFVCLDSYHYFIWLPTHIRSFDRKHYSSPTKPIHFYQFKKNKNNFFHTTITFWIVIIISLLINYPLSVFFFINTDKIFRWTFMLSVVHIFYGITASRFHLQRIRSARQVYCGRDSWAVWNCRKTFPRKQSIIIFPPIVKWRTLDLNASELRVQNITIYWIQGKISFLKIYAQWVTHWRCLMFPDLIVYNISLYRFED